LLAKGNKKGTKLHGVTVGGIREELPTLAGLMPEQVKTAAFMTNLSVERARHGQGVRSLFYDLKTDPREKTKLWSGNPAYKPLFDQLRAVRRGLAKAALFEEAGQALKSLGYIE
jgi:hypothetical protein